MIHDQCTRMCKDQPYPNPIFIFHRFTALQIVWNSPVMSIWHDLATADGDLSKNNGGIMG